eukprot:gene3139-biopygen3391
MCKAIASQPGKYISVFEEYPDPQLRASLMHACCESRIREALKIIPDINVGRSQTYTVHSAFARSRLKFKIEGKAQARECIRQHDGPGFLLVSGEGGGGKSTIMADLLLNEVKGTGAEVVICFTGCTSESCSLSDMLHSVYSETDTVLRTVPSARSPRLPDEDQMDLHDLWPAIHALYSRPDLCDDLPGLVIVLDAVNQLRDEPYIEDSTDLPSDLNWLPTTFPPSVKEILASRDVPDLLQLMLSKITDEFNRQTTGEVDGRGRSAVDVIEYALCAVYCSRLGLTGDELVQYLRQEQRRADGEERPDHIDSTVWVRLEMLLHLFLSPRRGMYNITHDFVRQAVERKYLGAGSTLAELEMEWLTARDTAACSPSVILDYSKKLQNAKEVLRSHHTRLALFYQILAYSGTGSGRVAEWAGGVVQRVPSEEARFHQKHAGLRPSVTVAVRVRPLTNDSHGEISPSATPSCMNVRGRKLYVVQRQVTSTDLGDPDMKGRVLAMDAYDFDYVLDSSDVSKAKTYASQSQVYKCLGADVVSDVMLGTNVTVIAYGQTSSGKSYTMFGPSDDPGLIPRTVRELLTRLTDMQAEGWTWKASCTMVEVYKDVAYDLLDYANAVRRGEGKVKKEVYIQCIRPPPVVISDGEAIATFADVAAIST